MEQSPTEAAQAITSRLKGRWRGNYGLARCPAHSDATPSLSISGGEKAVLFHCFAGCDSVEIMRALRKLGDIPHVKGGTAAPALRPMPHRDLAPLCRELWSLALPLAGSAAQRYLDRRAIGHSTIGKFSPAAITYDAGKTFRLPALLLPITKGRDLIALTRVFLTSDGLKSDRIDGAKRTLADPRGGAVQIVRIAQDHLNLAEGFEDAESVIAMKSLPGCWSVSGAELYASLVVPEHVRAITIYSQHGRAAAKGIAKAEANLTANGRTLDVVPPPPGGDWNDAWRAIQAGK